MSAFARSVRLLVASLIAAVVALVTAGQGAHAAGSGTPYTDPSAVGYIGLCNKAGQQITHGSINTKPFAWRAVSSHAAQAPYNEAGRTATLLAYQPRQGIPAGEWSGDELTASARYTNAAHPMVAATGGDDSLKDFIDEFHPAWDGLLQVRMYLGAPDNPIYSLTYPAIDIKVTGNTWQAVDGGKVACNSGKAESIETILLPKAKPKSKPKAHASGHPTATSSTGSAATSAPTSIGSAPAAAAAGGSSTPLAANTTADESGSNTSTIVGIVIAAVLLLAAVGYLVSRRRRPRPPSQSPGSLVHSTPEKGR